MALSPTSSGGGSGTSSLTKLYDSTVTGSDVASIDTGAASIAAGYTMLGLVFYGRTARVATSDEVWIQFNADATANYDWQRVGGASATASASTIATDNGLDALLPAASATANYFGIVNMTIPNYDGTVGFKVASWTDGVANGGVILNANTRVGTWKSTAAITRIKVISLNAANIKVGSRLIVYGYS